MGSEQNNGTSNPPSGPKSYVNNCGFFGNSKQHAASTITAAAKPPPPGAAGPSSNAANRCGSCNKKVGLIGFVCKCKITFCGKHRYPEMHQCTYDFKTSEREAISKANPVVKGDKVIRF